MNFYPSFKYQLSRYKYLLPIYYGVYLGLSLLFTGVFSVGYISSSDGHPASVISMTGISAVTWIVIFSASCCSFKENFRMSLQNGTSRQSLFLGQLAAGAALCGALAVCDELVTRLIGLLGRIPAVSVETASLLEMVYAPKWHPSLVWVASVFFTFFFLLAASAAGYFCTVLMYRLKTPGKVAVIAGAWAVFTFGIPILKMLRDRFHLEALWRGLENLMAGLLQLCFGGPANWMVTCLAVFCVIHFFTWLLIRRIPLK